MVKWVKVPKRLYPAPPRLSIAITLYPFVFVRADHWKNEALRAHESYHVYDIKRTGVVRWYVKYLSFLFRGKVGRNHPMEKPAYAIQDEYERIHGRFDPANSGS